MYRLGIDVGGTNTDAVIVDDQLQVVAHIKTPTTEDVYTGIVQAIKQVLRSSDIDRSQITQAMLGTTHCTNAIVERKNLADIGVLRLAAPATLGIKPMVDWASDLAQIAKEVQVIGGGFEFDGKELAPVDIEAAQAFFKKCSQHGVLSVAIIGVFGTVRDDQEVETGKLAQEILGSNCHLSLSSRIGSMGLVERENATILNATLYKVAQSFTEGFERSLQDENVTNAQVYFSQNDGTLMTKETTRDYPILTIASGPTNSIRGASYLSKLKNAIVVDVGGTTTDIGTLTNGFPRESSIAVTIGGVRTNFRMPDVISIGLGGGSIVRETENGITVGPDSVGYEITKKALVFGGDTLTATDIAVRLGLAPSVGNPELVQHLDQQLCQQALQVIKELVEDHIDAMKVSSEPVDIVLVGGGSIIIPEQLNGVKKVHKPKFFETANAIGAAISKVSGVFEQLISYDQTPRDDALELARTEAVRQAVENGAIAETVEIIDIEDVMLQYHDGNVHRVKAKAAGDLT
ncbi:MAG: hydantoinase/oxoprolinase family protein [Bifidobacteriaceae bacterium]|jgi:N-methylhydantoinase A/oxoprolinase/acetone carboxylase beta subunit|nr:hydantoinase/oxoprolinase family protein [Bifidobacteriaceae bacterium]